MYRICSPIADSALGECRRWNTTALNSEELAFWEFMFFVYSWFHSIRPAPEKTMMGSAIRLFITWSVPRSFVITMESIYSWLNTDAQVPTRVTPENIDLVFRNGYLLGEILVALKLERNTNFIKSSVPQAVVQNYTHIERILRSKLGLHIPPSRVLDIIHGNSGAALQVIYQIKSAYDNARVGIPTPALPGETIQFLL